MARMPLNFSITAEDPETVRSGLALKPGQRIVCICSAGDTPLNLLKYDPATIDAIDMNPAQVHLGILKVFALKLLPLCQFKALLGFYSNPLAAMHAYRIVRSSLPFSTQSFWDRHTLLIRRGLLWQGRVQRLLGLVRRALQLVGMAQVINEFAALRTQEEAMAFRQRYVDAWPYRWLWTGILNELTYRLFCTKDARRRLGSRVSGRHFLMQRLYFALSRVPVAREYLLPQVLGYYPQGVWPVYLDPAYVDLIRERAERIRFHTGDIAAYLQDVGEGSLDGTTLSNIADWLDVERLNNLLQMCLRATRDGGRILAYSRVAPLDVTKLDGVRTLADLSETLADTDHTGYYPHILVIEAQKRRPSA